MTTWHNLPIFLYGTLKAGEPNSYIMENKENGKQEFLGRAETVDKWPLVIGQPFNTPFMLDYRGYPQGERVTGELYHVDARMLERLDVLEGHPDIYRRTEIQVKVIDESRDVKVMDESREVKVIDESSADLIKHGVTSSDSRPNQSNQQNNVRTLNKDSNQQDNGTTVTLDKESDRIGNGVRLDNKEGKIVGLANGRVIRCEVYLMQNYQRSLLTQPMLHEYSRSVAHSMNKPYGGIPTGQEFFDAFSIVKDTPVAQ